MESIDSVLYHCFRFGYRLVELKVKRSHYEPLRLRVNASWESRIFSAIAAVESKIASNLSFLRSLKNVVHRTWKSRNRFAQLHKNYLNLEEKDID